MSLVSLTCLVSCLGWKISVKWNSTGCTVRIMIKAIFLAVGSYVNLRGIPVEFYCLHYRETLELATYMFDLQDHALFRCSIAKIWLY